MQFSAEAEPERTDNMAIDAFLSVHCLCLGCDPPLRPRALAGLVSQAILTNEKLAVAKECPTNPNNQARGKLKLCLDM